MSAEAVQPSPVHWGNRPGLPDDSLLSAAFDGLPMNPLTASKHAFLTIHASTRSRGVVATAHLVWRRLGDIVRVHRAPCAKLCEERVSGKVGLEIGGPSGIFSRLGLLPVYRHAARMDNCNFATQTVWEGEIHDGAPFLPEGPKAQGTQFIREATDLRGVDDEAYDFLCSSHTLEHIANPLQALAEWQRVLRVGGTLVLLLPHKDGTFDHRRPVTTLDHMIEDHARGIGDDDLTHLDEILELHDPSLDPAAGDSDAFKARSLENRVNRCLHHHVFDTDLAVRLVDHAGLQILEVECAGSLNIIVLCSKLAEGVGPDNRTFLADTASYRRTSPFPTDRDRLHAPG